jgi:hypothetical protein
MPNHTAVCLCDSCRDDGTGDFAMREAFAILRTDYDGRAFDLYRWIVDVRQREAVSCVSGARQRRAA